MENEQSEVNVEEQAQQDVEASEREMARLGDDAIAIIRELVQLSLLTGSNIVDHLRSLVLERDQNSGNLVPTPEYIEAYNNMVESLAAQAEQAQQEYEKTQEFSTESEEKDSADLN